MKGIYLASKSPRRRELLAQIGVKHRVLSVDVPEQQGPNESPNEYVERLARDKALAGCRELEAQGLPLAPVLGSDTLGVLQGRVFEKPRDRADAVAMLKTLSGQTHQILSAVALVLGDRVAVTTVTTDVTFRELGESEILRYWDTGEPADKAGAYAIQGMAAVFVERIEGSYSAVVGLPLTETAQLLEDFGVALWHMDA
ncbi:MAG: Maf family protein [Pseudomonadota bacterium]|nr:Maf family protein [Pseudomonadota bacterium]